MRSIEVNFSGVDLRYLKNDPKWTMRRLKGKKLLTVYSPLIFQNNDVEYLSLITKIINEKERNR